MPQASASSTHDASARLANARDHLIVGVADAVDSGVEAARDARDRLVESGRGVIGEAAQLIRSRPLATVGVALAVGYLFAKATGRR